MKFCFRVFMVVLFSLATFLNIHSTAQRKDKEDFPILAWYGPGVNKTELSAFQYMKEAGFTICYTPFGDKLSNLRLLHIADSLEFDVLLSDERLDSLITARDSIAVTIDQIVADYQAFSSLWGYMLYDKPGFTHFERLGLINKYIRERDPVHPVFINLPSIYSEPGQLEQSNYFNYVWEFIDKTNPGFLAFEHFPVTHEGLSAVYYKNLEIIRKASLDKGIPFWARILSVPHLLYPEPEHSHLRFQIYSALAYGAKGLSYFTFVTPDSQLWDYGYALLDREGVPTTTYEYAATINKEIHQLAPALVKLKSTGVYHSEPAPAGCSLPTPDLPIIRVESESILMGFFEYKKEKYVLLVNKNYLYGARPRLYFSNKVKKIQEISKNDFKPLVVNFKSTDPEKSCNILFKAGDGRLFRIYD
ncbi:hypothetical protein JXQ31_06745 [candidate division KSB1 bacterium]|nr:hypothetical protein [candidate division KSB1 bacterium]